MKHLGISRSKISFQILQHRDLSVLLLIRGRILCLKKSCQRMEEGDDDVDDVSKISSALLLHFDDYHMP